MKVVKFILKVFGKIIGCSSLILLILLYLIFFLLMVLVDLIVSLIESIFLSEKECLANRLSRTRDGLQDFLKTIFELLSKLITN